MTHIATCDCNWSYQYDAGKKLNYEASCRILWLILLPMTTPEVCLLNNYHVIIQCYRFVAWVMVYWNIICVIYSNKSFLLQDYIIVITGTPTITPIQFIKRSKGHIYTAKCQSVVLTLVNLTLCIFDGQKIKSKLISLLF